MRVTIFPQEGTISIDGRLAKIDMGMVNPNFRAVQWYDDHGLIETGAGENIAISNLNSFQFLIDQAVAVFNVEDHPPLEEVRVAKTTAVDNLLDQKLLEGVAYQGAGGRVLQLDQASQDRIGNVALKAAIAKLGLTTWPSDEAWRMKDNSSFPLVTADDMLAMSLFSSAEVQRLRKVAWAHKDSLALLDSIPEIETYDITAGW